jgi:hypothetical protein
MRARDFSVSSVVHAMVREGTTSVRRLSFVFMVRLVERDSQEFSMKIEFNKHGEDGHGDITITCQCADDVKDVQSIYSPFEDDIVEYASHLVSGSYVHHLKSGGKSYYGDIQNWYEVEGHLDQKFSDPYVDLFNSRTGLILDKLPDATLYENKLGHTHSTFRCWIADGLIRFHCFTFSGSKGWNKMTAPEYARYKVLDYKGEEFGGRNHEPEFLPTGGLYRKNPNYLKRHEAHAASTNHLIKDLLFKHWLDNFASESQKDVIKSAKEYSIYYEGWNKHHTWESLRSLS